MVISLNLPGDCTLALIHTEASLWLINDDLCSQSCSQLSSHTVCVDIAFNSLGSVQSTLAFTGFQLDQELGENILGGGGEFYWLEGKYFSHKEYLICLPTQSYSSLQLIAISAYCQCDQSGATPLPPSTWVLDKLALPFCWCILNLNLT